MNTVLNKQAEVLNSILLKKSPEIYSLLSNYGKKIFFPVGGILAQSKEAKGKKYNATIGQALNDDGSPMILTSLSHQLAIPDTSLLYAPSYGQAELRELWKKEIKRKNSHLTGNFSLPIVTNGLTHGLSLAYKLFINSDDDIILPDLYWGNYNLTFEEGNIKIFPLFKNNTFNLDGLDEILGRKGEKKVLVLNFPNNPTGYSPSEKIVNEIIKILIFHCSNGKKIVIIIDDAYFGLAYETDIYKQSLFSKLISAHKNLLAIKIDGLSKEAFAWGLRVGFISLGFQGITKEIAKVFEDKIAGTIRGNISNVSNVSQSMAINMLKSDTYITEQNKNNNILLHRYGEIKKVLNNNKYTKYFEALPYNSGYFMCIKLKKHKAGIIRQKLLSEYSTGVIGLGEDILRISFSTIPIKDIYQLFENIYLSCDE